MTTAARPLALARRNSYFAISRSHRYSILFALPLLLGYEALAALLSQPGKGELRNGADALLRGAFTMIAGAHGAAIFMAAIIVIGIGLVVRDLRASKDRIRSVVFLQMPAESTALALAFGFVIGITTAKLLGSLQSLSTSALALSPLTQTSWATRLMLSLGAGLY